MVSLKIQNFRKGIVQIQTYHHIIDLLIDLSWKRFCIKNVHFGK